MRALYKLHESSPMSFLLLFSKTFLLYFNYYPVLMKPTEGLFLILSFMIFISILQCFGNNQSFWFVGC